MQEVPLVHSTVSIRRMCFVAFTHFIAFAYIERALKRKADDDKKDARNKRRMLDKPINTPPCPSCVKAGIYDPLNHHSRSSSANCPLRAENINDYLKNLLGDKFRRTSMKTGLKKLLRLEGAEADRFVNQVERVTDLIRHVAVTSLLFATIFITKWLEEDNQEPPPRLFTSAFFYACQQLVLGRAASGNDIPVAELTSVYEAVKRYASNIQVPGEQLRHSSFSPMMAYLAQQSKTIFINQIVEAFPSRALSWFRFTLQIRVPVMTLVSIIYLYGYLTIYWI